MMQQLTEIQRLPARTERVYLAFLQSDIDLALTYLRLAEAESKIWNSARAAELIEKAILGYKSAVTQIENLPLEFIEERGELRERVQRLFEAIVAAERQLQILTG